MPVYSCSFATFPDSVKLDIIGIFRQVSLLTLSTPQNDTVLIFCETLNKNEKRGGNAPPSGFEKHWCLIDVVDYSLKGR